MKEGDTVTVSGLPQAQCATLLAAGLDGEVSIGTLDGDDVIATLTPAAGQQPVLRQLDRDRDQRDVAERRRQGDRERRRPNAPVKLERRVPDLDFVTEQGNRVWGCSRKENSIYACALGDPTNWYSYRGIASDSYAVSVGSDGAFTGAASCLGYLLFFKENCIHKLYGYEAKRLPDEQRAVPGRGGKRGKEPVRDRGDAVLSFAGRGDGVERKPADQGVRRAGHREADGGGPGRGRAAGRAVLPVPAPENRRAADGFWCTTPSGACGRRKARRAPGW